MNNRTSADSRSPNPFFATRACAILTGLLVFIATAAFYAGGAAVGMFSILLISSLITIFWFGSAAVAGWVILRRIIRLDRPDVPTSAALGLGIFSLIALALGLAGMLNTWTIYALAIISLLAGAVELYSRLGNASLEPYAQTVEGWLNARAGWGWLWVACAFFAAVAAVSAALPPGILWPGDPHPYDVLEYHLQIPREWYEAHRIIPLHHNVFSYFPFNVEMHYLIAMHLRGGPWAAMFQVHFFSLGYMTLAVLAIANSAATTRQRALAGFAACVVPWLAVLGSVAYNECGLILYGALAISWTLRALCGAGSQPALSPSPSQGEGRGEGRNAHRPNNTTLPITRPLIIAALMTGFACGTKYTAVPLLLIALPVIALLVALFHHSNKSRWLRATILFFAIAGATFSPWLIRNQIWTANPVFPEAMPTLGKAHFSDIQVTRWQRAHSPRDDQHDVKSHLDAFLKEVIIDWRYAYALFPLALAAALIAWRDPSTQLLFLMLLTTAIFWLGFTHLQSRFFVLAIPIAAMLIARLPSPFTIPAVAILALAGFIGWWGVGKSDDTPRGVHPLLAQYVHSDDGHHERSAGQLIWTAGLNDLSIFLPDDIRNAATQSDRVILVGDSRAYLYPMEMKQLRYRTVFDVDNTNRPTLSAWAGDVPDGWTVITDRIELRRFEKTYFGLTFPPDMQSVPARKIKTDLRRNK